jgi:osmotically inducible protein OsmC
MAWWAGTKCAARAFASSGGTRHDTILSNQGICTMKRSATANWTGSLTEGNGTLDTLSGAISALPYTFKGRFVDESGQSGTNPEELIAAAHAGCFAMQFAHFLWENGTVATQLQVSAVVELIPGTGITSSALTVVGKVDGIDEAKFVEIAERAKGACPVSNALGAIAISLDAKLG